MEKVKIRPLRLNDFNEVKEVDILTQWQYLGNKWDQFSDKEKEEHLVSRQSEFQANVDTGYGFVAVSAECEIIGFILAYETLPFKGTVYIRHIAIRPELQGKGVGVLLYEAVIDNAKEAGIKKVQSMINLDNPKSIRLHEKVGFSLRDRKEAVINLDDK